MTARKSSLPGTDAIPLPTPHRFQQFAGGSRSMRECYRLLELAAGSDVTVLLLGESGTGKELAANAIHHLSHRRNRPLIQVNCAALPETILESELFGHLKGAFTGAYRDRIGRFEAADGGTMFLDEIGELSPATQAKLLRVLQQRSFERVGDTRTRTVDVRLIAATNRDLAQLVRDGRFREDLYYRLKVFPLTLPPLRQHLEDIPELLAHLIAQLRQKTGKSISGLDEQAMRAVMDYCWPGNVRELENALEFAFVTCQSGTITLFDLPLDLRQFELRRATCAERQRRTVASGNGIDAREILASPDRMKQLIKECGGNKAEAARRLGISRTALWKWLKRANPAS